jgi:hypothetical protein
MSQTRRNNPVKGWKREKPGFHQKTVMLKKCGRKCFLGPGKSFPICKKNTCRVSSHGVYAAYMRSRQYRNKSRKYVNISKRAEKMLVKIAFRKSEQNRFSRG